VSGCVPYCLVPAGPAERCAFHASPATFCVEYDYSGFGGGWRLFLDHISPGAIVGTREFCDGFVEAARRINRDGAVQWRVVPHVEVAGG